MRKFNDKEKEIIKSIYNNYNKSTSGYILFNVFYNELYSLGAYYSDGEFVVDKKDEEKLPLIEMKIMDVYSLLSFLERNGYILLVDCSLPTSACNIPNFIENPIKCSLSKECGEFIEKTRSRKLFITTKIIELVSNDFKTYEEIQLEEAKKQTRWSIRAVYLSILTLIASIVMPIILSKCSTDPIENKMVKSQFDSIQSKQNELINTLYPLKNIQITNDSLIKELNEIKISKIDNDSLIKELNLLNQSIDEISNTLKELKKMNSKGK